VDSFALIRVKLPQNYTESRKLLARNVLAVAGRACLDIRPRGADWELVVVISGLDEAALLGLIQELRSESGFDLLSSQIMIIDDLGHVLDREMTKLEHFRGQPEKMKEYLVTKFGQRVVRRKEKKQSKDDPLIDDFLQSLGLFADQAQDVEPTPIVPISGADYVETVPDEFLNGVPDGWTGASSDPEMATREGQQCRVCGGETVRHGVYVQEGQNLVRIQGNGPLSMPASAVFDPTGDLRLRVHS